jgi:uncharacterized membrane protein
MNLKEKTEMENKSKLATLALAAIISSSVSVSSAQAAPRCDMEKCYGVAKIGANDCGTKGHACQGQSKVNSDPGEWMFVAKGTCKNIVGGNTSPANDEG